MAGVPTIAWIGGMYFRPHMEKFGFRTAPVALEKPDLLGWEDVCERAGCEPDIILYADRSLPPPLSGLASLPVPTVFFAIDSHIHTWYPAYAQGFDLVAASLRDHVGLFAPGKRLAPEQVLWLPPMAKDTDRPVPGLDKEYDLLFVGKVDPETTPERHAFLAELKSIFPGLAVAAGEYTELYSKARLVLNVAERGDLNYRVFEALGCGACLLTPAIGQSQDELFRDGRHLFTYPPGDAGAVAALAEKLLADEPLRRAVAARGMAEVDAAHRMEHRAGALARFIRSNDVDALVKARLADAEKIHAAWLKLVYLHWAEACAGSDPGGKYLRAATFGN